MVAVEEAIGDRHLTLPLSFPIGYTQWRDSCCVTRFTILFAPTGTSFSGQESAITDGHLMEPQMNLSHSGDSQRLLFP